MSSRRGAPAWGQKGNAKSDPGRNLGPIVLALKILGLFPFSDDAEPFAFATIYAVAAEVLYFTLTAVSIVKLFQIKSVNTLYRISAYIRCITSLLNVTASLCWALRGRRLRALWISLLSEERPGAEVVRRPCGARAAALIHPATLLLVVAANLAARASFWMSLGETLPALPIAANCTELVLQWARSVLGVAAAVLLKRRFMRLNSLLARVRLSPRHRASRDRRRRCSVAPLALVSDGGREEGAARVVADCRRVHASLTRHSRDAAAAVGLSFLLDACSLFLFVTSHIYYTIEFFEHNTDAPKRLAVLLRVCYVALRVVPFFAVLVACDSASEEANFTRAIVSSALAYPLSRKVSNQLRLFSVQLLHWKAEFSASGVIPLDSTMIQAMTANVLTYIVIIVQFASSVEESSITVMDEHNATSTAVSGEVL